MTKTCNKCGLEKSVRAFNWHNRARRYLRSTCKVCQKAENAIRYTNKYNEQMRLKRNETADWIKTLKSNPCLDCNRTFPPECMDFDHVRGNKVRAVSEMTMCSKEYILTEIAKCELVCACCHRIRTHKRLDVILGRVA